MLNMIIRTALYVFILIQISTTLTGLLLTSGAIAVLEVLSYFQGQNDAIDEMVKVKVNNDGN